MPICALGVHINVFKHKNFTFDNTKKKIVYKKVNAQFLKIIFTFCFINVS
jgi:hypothetical protein